MLFNVEFIFDDIILIINVYIFPTVVFCFLISPLETPLVVLAYLINTNNLKLRGLYLPERR